MEKLVLIDGNSLINRAFYAMPVLTTKDGTPTNSFNISMLPWVEFTGFNINVFDKGKFLLPVFTMGKYFEHNGQRLLPLAIQVHHAVCDGYHVGLFIEKLQNYIDNF